MESLILNTHIAITTVFLLFFVFKTVLLLAGKKELLGKIRDRGKMVDMVLGLLVLASGGYLFWALWDVYGHRMWLDIKVVLVLIAIPLGIISMRKESKPLAILVSLLLIYVYGVAETKSLTFSKPKTEINASE